jgi:hypothetical protein
LIRLRKCSLVKSGSAAPELAERPVPNENSYHAHRADRQLVRRSAEREIALNQCHGSN